MANSETASDIWLLSFVFATGPKRQGAQSRCRAPVLEFQSLQERRSAAGKNHGNFLASEKPSQHHDAGKANHCLGGYAPAGFPNAFIHIFPVFTLVSVVMRPEMKAATISPSARLDSLFIQLSQRAKWPNSGAGGLRKPPQWLKADEIK